MSVGAGTRAGLYCSSSGIRKVEANMASSERCSSTVLKT